MPAISKAQIRVADEVWISAALLQREHPNRKDFSIEEILERVTQEAKKLPRPGVYVHIVQHCVANRPPSPGRYRMLYETAPGRRRLFRTGDNYDRAREGSKTVPEREEIPPKYLPLLDWYRNWNRVDVKELIENDPLLALYGDGKDLWADEGADDYVRRLRKGWE
jgi:hypothetical protein